jgi:hypothetical protein
MLVMYVVSLPTYVNVAHLYLFVGGFCNWFRLRAVGFSGCSGKELL